MIRRVVLVGLSGTGKSSVGSIAAEHVGWSLIDTDAEIERRTCRTIPDIFRDDGEPAFRKLERTALLDALSRDQTVVATGGGAVIESDIWSAAHLGDPSTLVIWLDADPETLVDRLLAHARKDGAAADRPLLYDGDVLAKLTTMRNQRRDAYARADIVLDVTRRAVSDVAADVEELVRLGTGEETLLRLDVAGASSAIHVGPGSRFRIAELTAQRWPKAQQLWVAIDSNLEPHISAEIEALCINAHATVNTRTVPSGESSKSLAGIGDLYDWMLTGGVERGDVVIAIGGGVVGDLSGFAAASVLRGIGLVQVPSTLLSMVDSSVGGKTGINHEAGKNLIGAFYQPPVVVIDPELLRSLPERELRSGWGEIIKHAVIEPSTPGGEQPMLLDILERNVDTLSRLEAPLTPWLIRRNVSLKAAVVEADEREAGIRAFLNFGHTIGHGIEAAGYSLLHGEAVAVGMCAALFIGCEMHLVDQWHVNRVRALIQAFGLPTRADVDSRIVLTKMASDKKKSSGKQKWVLPIREGGVSIVTEVLDDVIERAIEAVTGPAEPPLS